MPDRRPRLFYCASVDFNFAVDIINVHQILRNAEGGVPYTNAVANLRTNTVRPYNISNHSFPAKHQFIIFLYSIFYRFYFFKLGLRTVIYHVCF
jgi:hypothetical protein